MKEKEEQRLALLKAYEQELYQKNHKIIAGIDEAGRGPLAGPVVVGVVILKPNSWIEGVNDSKKIAEKRREKIYEEIIKEALSYSIAIIDETEIDEINILNATKKAVTKGIDGLAIKPDHILIDALDKIDTLGIPYTPIVKGDSKIYSIAAASIIAKVTRDRMMQELDKQYPVYGFAKHKGYGTSAHIAAIKEYGPCKVHRKSFIKNFV